MPLWLRLPTFLALHGNLTHVGSAISAIYEKELPDGDDVNASAWQGEQCVAALVVLAKKAYEKGYNTLLSIKAYEGVPSSNGDNIFEFIASGIPALVTLPDGHAKSSFSKGNAPHRKLSYGEMIQNQHVTSKAARGVQRQKGLYLDDVGICNMTRNANS